MSLPLQDWINDGLSGYRRFWAAAFVLVMAFGVLMYALATPFLLLIAAIGHGIKCLASLVDD